MNRPHEHGDHAAENGRSEQRILSMTPDGAASASIDAVLHQRIDAGSVDRLEGIE